MKNISKCYIHRTAQNTLKGQIKDPIQKDTFKLECESTDSQMVKHPEAENSSTICW